MSSTAGAPRANRPDSQAQVARELPVAEAIHDAVYGVPRNLVTRASVTTLIVLLYLAGGLFWASFLNYGRISFTNEDWAKRMLISYSVIHESMETGRLPLVVAEPLRFGQYETDQFLSNPELPLSPQIVLLRWLSIGDFVLVNFLLLYSLGFVGCWLLSRRLKLPFAAFAILVLIFNLNGHILAHISAGHAGWGGYFLLPYFLLWTVELVEAPRNRFSAAELKIALLLGVIMLQGGIHVFLWIVVFLTALGICHWPSLRRAALAVLLGSLVCAVRLIPASMVFWGYKRQFFPGFQSFPMLMQAFVGEPGLLPARVAAFLPFERSTWWEYDTFVGVFGFGFILVFGLVQPLRHWWRTNDSRLLPLLPPALILALFSFGNSYRVFYESPFPILNGERVPSRFLLLCLLAVLVIGLSQFASALSRSRRTLLILVPVTSGVLALASELLAHSARWSIATAQGEYVPPSLLLMTLQPPSAGPPDGTYLSSLFAGLAISCLTVIAIGIHWRSSVHMAAATLDPS